VCACTRSHVWWGEDLRRPFWGGEGGWLVKRVEMVKMPYLLTTVVVFKSETCLVLLRQYAYDNEIIIRPAIDHGG